MPKYHSERARWRGLLTETLPFEVPVIFSNEKLYASLLAPPQDTDVKSRFDTLFNAPEPGTVPYSYSVRKDKAGRTALAIIHPHWQMKISEFYDQYADSIIYSCAQSEYSLRHPTGIVPVYSARELANEVTFKLGIPHIDPGEGEIDVSHVTSFFTYSRFNLLAAFIESNEYIKLERKFEHQRSLDISKCFFNIYTHTVTWAVKQREFSKEHRHQYSFESRFDEIIQKSNNNETNGIVVGPEVSRIFAEIILQDVDAKIKVRLEKAGIVSDVAIRRYVDDYFIFSHDIRTLDRVESFIRGELEFYKLYLNDKKSSTLTRPFISDITLAKRDLRPVLDGFFVYLRGIPEIADPGELRKALAGLRGQLSEIRVVVARNGVGFHTVSAWLTTILKAAIRQLVRYSVTERFSDEQKVHFAGAVRSFLNTIFYIAALDPRVRTAFNLCQVLSSLRPLLNSAGYAHSDSIGHAVVENFVDLAEAVYEENLRDEIHESVELYNLLICGAYYLRSEFLSHPTIMQIIRKLVQLDIRYFGFASLKFCMLKSKALYGAELDQINRSAEARLVAGGKSAVMRESEQFLLLCDFLASPDMPVKSKRRVFGDIFGGNPSTSSVEGVSKLVGFVDWDGLRIEHLLARKELRPVYG